MAYLRLESVERRIRLILKSGRFYLRKSILHQIGGPNRVRSQDLKTVLQRLRKEGIISYSKRTRFWVVIPTDEPKSIKVKKPGPIQGESEIISRLESVSQEMAKKALKELIPFAVERVEKIIKSMARSEIVGALEDDERFKEVVNTSTKERVGSIFKLDVIPVLLSNQQDRVEKEVVTRMAEMRKQVETLRTEIKYIRKVIVKASADSNVTIQKFLAGR